MEISVIVPMYNCITTIKDLINSLDNQNFLKFEVILVNDGSSDGTLLLAESLCKMRDNFYLLNQKNQGAPKARNLGLKYARGKYIYFCDADDILPPDSLSILYKMAEKNKSDLIVGKIAHFQDSIKNYKTYAVCPRRSEILGKYKYYMCNPVPGTKLFKKDLIDSYNIKFDDVKIAQDLNFYLKYLSVAKNPYIVNEIVYYYRHTKGSISRTYDVNKILDIKKSFKYVEDFYKSNIIQDMLLKKKCLEYVKLSNYLWQLRKRKHFSDVDYKILKNEFYKDIHLLKNVRIANLIVYSQNIIEFKLAIYLGRTIKNI